MSEVAPVLPPLIPMPRSVRVTGGAVALRAGALAVHCAGVAWREVVSETEAPEWVEAEGPAAADVVVRVTESGVERRSIHGQSYRLEIVRSGERLKCFARIDAPSASGARYGLATLRQLVRCARFRDQEPTLGQGWALGAHNEWALREMVVEDEPSFAMRGVMLDVSRDRVPTMEMLFELVEQLAALKINHLQLYMEHTFAYAGHEEVWRDASPLTADDIRVLDARAARVGIELSANQNCFGHLTRWLKLPRYAPLAETHGEWVFDNGEVRVPRSGPFSLCPVDPASLAFVDDLLGQLLPCFASPRVNIGCDETFDVGTGRSRKAVEQRGRAAVYGAYVNAVAAIARRHAEEKGGEAARPMFWADIALREAGALDLLDGDLTALVWGYEADAPFDRWCRSIREAAGGGDREIWMCPGTSAWRSITGRTTERRGNLLAAARAGLEHGATGYLVTEWGDHGHRQQWPIALHALADGAGVAWNVEAAQRLDARATGIHLMGDRTSELGPWLDELGEVDGPVRGAWEIAPCEGRPPERILNATALYSDMHEPLTVEPHFGGDVSQWKFLKARLATLMTEVPRFPSELIHDEMWLTLNVCRFAIMRGLLRRGDREWAAADLARFMRQIIEEHRRLWLKRSRPGGLEDSCRYYEALAEELQGTT